MAGDDYPESDPRHTHQPVKRMFGEPIKHPREDMQKFDEPRAQAMFETASEVLIGLRKAFEDYKNGSERALRTRVG